MQLVNPTRNIISNNNSLRAQSLDGLFISPETFSHNWVCTNATLSIDSINLVHPLNYSFKIQPLNENSAIVFSLSGIIPSDTDINGSQAQFHCQTFSSEDLNIVAKITNVVANTFKTNTQNLSAEKWEPSFTPVIDVGLIDLDLYDVEFDIELTITNHGGQFFYLSMPTLFNELGFTKNTFVANIRKFIPTFMWDKDKIQEFPNYPLIKFFHILTHYGDLSTVLYKKFFSYLNNEVSLVNQNADFRFSELIEPEYVDLEYRDWLSQFNGTTLYQSITTSVNSEAINNVNESIEWQLVNGYFGRNAGTLNSIKECTQQVLSGNKVVYVFSGGSFFQINIYTLLSETPGTQNAGDTSPQVVALATKTKPMGFVINHEAYATLPIILDDAVYGQLGGETAPTAPGLA